MTVVPYPSALRPGKWALPRQNALLRCQIGALVGAFALFPGAAEASPVGIVVRLDATNGTVKAPVVAQLKGSAEKPLAIQLNDSGEQPDVTAGDGLWAGHGLVDDDNATYSLEIAGKTLEGGRVSWEAGEGPKDLDIVLTGSTLTATPTRRSPQEQGGSGLGPSSVGPPAAGGSVAGSSGTSGTGATGPSAGNAPASGGNFTTASTSSPRPRSANFPAESSGGSATLFIAFGLGLLVLVGVLWAWSRRSRPETGEVMPGNLTLQPEPGLFGPGTHSLSDGLCLWITPPGGITDQLRPLLGTLAQSHRVLVVAPSSVQVPAVYGGPVYRMNGARPSHIALSAEALFREGGQPLAVLLVGLPDDEPTLRETADQLPVEVGGVVLTETEMSGPLPKLRCEVQGPGQWTLRATGDAAAALLLTEDSYGFIRQPTA